MSLAFKPYPFSRRTYSSSLPPLHGGVEQGRRPIVVIGAGPVGLTTALAVAQHGVPVVLIEADDSVCVGSRAICISRRSLEILGRVGAADEFLRMGLPWTGGRSFYRDQEVLHFKMPQDENQKLPPMINLAQYQMEQILLDRAHRLPELIDIRWQTKVAAVHPSDEIVRLTLSTPLGDYQLEADWLVAADGGRSFVRDALGLTLRGTSYEGRYVIVDISLESERPTERLAYFDPPSNPGSTVLVHKQPDNVWRIDYQLRDGENPEEAVKLENVAPRVSSLLTMLGEQAPWSPIWIGIYKANALTLERYRHGRVLFAGDAAHLLPIFGVRGANSGIDDADNLAWKLALVIRGLASERLLDSYSDERVAAAHENLRHGTKSTEFMAPPSFAFEVMRRAVLGLAIKHDRVRSLINPRQTSAITYSASPLNIGLDHSAAFDAGPAPGAVLAECPLTIACDIPSPEPRQGHLTDLIASCFTVLHFCERSRAFTEMLELEQAMTARKIPFRVVPITRHLDVAGVPMHGWDHTGRLFSMYGAKPGTTYLVRPDGHVLARWLKVSTAEIAAAIEHVLHP
jgi:3-(3-hydroxy-phenyl)propionate hydroxylase